VYHVERGQLVLHVTTYRIKPFATSADRAKIMELFAEHGTTSGTTGNYISADGTLGWLVGDDDISEIFKNILVYVEYLEYEVRPVLPVEEAAPLLVEAFK